MKGKKGAKPSESSGSTRAREDHGGHSPYKKHLKKPFLEMFRELRTIGAAAEKVGTTQKTVRRWRDEDPEFAAAFEEVDTNITDELKTSTLERAIKGVEVISYNQQGGVSRVTREYSDRMAELHLKQRDPSFRDRVQVDVVNKVALRVISEIVEVIRIEVQDQKLLSRIQASLEARLGVADEVAN